MSKVAEIFSFGKTKSNDVVPGSRDGFWNSRVFCMSKFKLKQINFFIDNPFSKSNHFCLHLTFLRGKLP